VPDHVEAEFEVEITGDEVEVELEFTWRLTPPVTTAAPEQD
jgi:hypothetical protein